MRDGKRGDKPVAWVPSLYFAMGIPFAMAIWVTGTMLKDLGHSDTETALVTGSIAIAWSLKPFWASFLDMYRTKRFFVLSMEVLLSILLAAIALSLRLPNYFQVIVVVLWMMAFSSATQDICADGIYITALSAKKEQDAWMGVQGAGWNVGRIFATSAMVAFAGLLKERGFDGHAAWMFAIGASALAMAALAVYHYFTLPTGTISRRPDNAREVVSTFWDTVTAFFQKKSIWGMLLFVFLYRSGEGFLLVEAPLFMQAPLEKGGLGLTLGQKGVIDGTVSTIVTIIAGLLGGKFVSRFGLKKSLFVLALSMNVPHLCYIYLSHAVSPGHPLPLWTVYLLVSIEKFGYGFGFIGNMLYMMQQIAPGRYKMAHYAFATALMNLVLVPTQSASGYLADMLGYKSFFIFVLVASIPSIIAAYWAPFPDPPDVEEAAEPVAVAGSQGAAA